MAEQQASAKTKEEVIDTSRLLALADVAFILQTTGLDPETLRAAISTQAQINAHKWEQVVPEASSEDIKSQGTSQPFIRWKPSEELQKEIRGARKRSSKKRTLKESKSLEVVTKTPKHDIDQVGQRFVPEPKVSAIEKVDKAVVDFTSPSVSEPGPHVRGD